MSAIKFSQLTVLTSGTSDTILPAVQNGKNWKISLDTVKSFVGAPAWQSVTNKPAFWEGTFNGGDYNSLTNKPTIPSVPTLVSAFTNDRNYLTSVDYGIITNAPTLSAIATSGHYQDLIDAPLLATVSTSGSYVDLSHKPVIPTDISELTDTTNVLARSIVSDRLSSNGHNLVLGVDGTLNIYPSVTGASVIQSTSGIWLNSNGKQFQLSTNGAIDLPLVNGTTGLLRTSGNLTLNATGKEWLFEQNGSIIFPDGSTQVTAGGVVQSATAPTTNTSTIWYDTITGRSYVYFDSNWVDANPNLETLSLATLKTVVAASTDFADFQSRIAAL